jgi:precorrin-2 dehydrogenase/sirohydrochlorin ferrochelatase
MRYYPICLDVKDKRCIVIGGGDVALRKISSLIECDAKVVVISPEINEAIEQYVQEKKIKWLKRKYRSSDLRNTWLVIVATNDKELNIQIAQQAKKIGIPVNVVNSIEESTFIVPAVLSRGSLTIAVSTEGKSPALARKIRDTLKGMFGKEYIEFVELLGSLRETMKERFDTQKKREIIWNRLVNSELLGLLKRGRKDQVDKVLKQYGIERK